MERRRATVGILHLALSPNKKNHSPLRDRGGRKTAEKKLERSSLHRGPTPLHLHCSPLSAPPQPLAHQFLGPAASHPSHQSRCSLGTSPQLLDSTEVGSARRPLRPEPTRSLRKQEGRRSSNSSASLTQAPPPSAAAQRSPVAILTPFEGLATLNRRLIAGPAPRPPRLASLPASRTPNEGAILVSGRDPSSYFGFIKGQVGRSL
ncbi:uncharacterized protein LOC124992829 [Sciurus carolinensis]|uniref:uncharacterized protein LOC124992829 n=1 Tax=Sciurus carolinensis TaxID=30640 RepID=UPI001FB2E6E7|nr:uncharacterized protein LOC124992829 [Sciurus carolinensis]